MNRFQKYYKQIIRKELINKHSYESYQEIPQISSIHLHIFLKEAIQDKKNIIPILSALEWITGQRAKPLRARHSVASFKLREGQYVGAKVTLRGENAYNFLETLITVVLPRQKDFKGYPVIFGQKEKGFDGNGNFTFGLTEVLLFPELEYEYDKFHKIRGMDITIKTTAKTNSEAASLLSAFQFPFKQ